MVQMQMEWTEGDQAHIGSVCPLVIAWVINHLPSPMLTGLALSCACLPTHAMISDNVNVASLASPKVSPSPNEWHPQNKTAHPGQVTVASVRPVLPS